VSFNFADTVYREQDFDIHKEYFRNKIKDKTEEKQKEYWRL
jgi:hypothetical protein